MNRLTLSAAGCCLLFTTSLPAATSMPLTLPVTVPAGAESRPGLPLPQPGSLPASPLAGVVSTLLPADLQMLTQVGTPAVTTLPVLPAFPALAPCRFGGTNITLDFGQVPPGVDAQPYTRQLILQVECSQATEFSISSQEPPADFGTVAERSAVPVSLRGAANTYSGVAWALLEQDGQPLAARRFSVPADSPTLIAINALLLASPETRITPSLPGELESLMLARQLYLIVATEP